jgi:hypothetical protein
MRYDVNDMPIELEAGGLVTRYVELGDMAIRHATVPAGGDMGPLLAGLPDDRCPSPHWGIVIDGAITVTQLDGSVEEVTAGQMYHWPAGHTGVTVGGVTFLEIGPVGPMREFGDHAKEILAG